MKLQFMAATLFLIVNLTCVQAQKANNSSTNKKGIVTQEEKNKQIVTAAYQRIFGDLDTTAVDDSMSKDFIQHNPTIADGPEGVKALVQMLVSKGVLKQKIEFKAYYCRR